MKTVKPSIPVTVPAIVARKQHGPKIAAITAYDYTFARLFDRAGVDLILVGDSLASVVQGLGTTLPVTLDEIIYHARCVRRGAARALVVADLPFMSYQRSEEQALDSAGRVLKESGASAVKLEGGVPMESTIRRLVEVDIPVVGHIGLTPQSFHRMGGHRIQGRVHDSAASRAGSYERLIEDARAVERAGAFALVIEGVPGELAAEITAAVSIPTIGIGAGSETDGQILVMHDLLGLTEDAPSFAKPFDSLGARSTEAVLRYVEEIRSGEFPARARTGTRGG